MIPKTALFSVSDKTGIVEFAQALIERGYAILASGGTAQRLADAGVPVHNVATLVGEPILGHRVVTLSREIHAALLTRDTKEDNAELARLRMPRIDLVCVDLYPLEKTIATPGVTAEAVVEATDIGGPTLLRSAAKGGRVVVCDPADRQRVLDWLDNGMPDGDAFKRQLAAKAEFVVAKYALASAMYHGNEEFFGMMGSRIDGVIAPSYNTNAIQLLQRKTGKCRLLVNPALDVLSSLALDGSTRFRHVRGGMLVQPNYEFVFRFYGTNTLCFGTLDDPKRRDLLLAWAVCATSNSNTITLVNNRMLIGNGVGQQDRVGAAELAIKRARDAGHDVAGAVAASDSFFPFPDGVEVLADAGVTAILATSGSVKDEKTIAVCRERKVALVLVPDSIGRGFFGH